VDKFYLLFRRFTNAAFRLLARQGWEQEGVSQFVALLVKEGGPLCSNDVKVPDGITYHLADVYVEELDRALETAIGEENRTTEPVPALALLQPFISTMATCHSQLVFDRISKAVILPFLEDCLTLQEAQQKEKESKKRKAESQKGTKKRRKGEEAEAEENKSDAEDGQDTDGCEYAFLMDQMMIPGKEIRKETFDAIFQAASAKDSIEARRRRLYKLCKEEEERLEEEEG
jgi:ribosomal RNA-processing protein 1